MITSEMPFDASAVLKTVIDEGHAFIKVNLDFLRNHQLAIKSFFERRKTLGDFEKWSFQVPGEEETEAGIVLPRVGKDIKFSLHESHFFQSKISKLDLLAEDYEFLILNQKLYNYAQVLSAYLIKELGRMFNDEKLLNSYWDSCLKTIPYSITTLRSLYYPAVVEQKGARSHINRNLVTIHFGDVGGNLVFYQSEGDKEGKVVLVPEGQAVIFFGVKILWVSEGRIQPLWHGSSTLAGQARLANPFFAHVEVPNYIVKDARTAFNDYNSTVPVHS